MTIKIYKKEPDGFLAKVQVAACYLEIDGKILLLQRADGHSEAGKWGVPAGKLEKGEALEEAAIRELFEETGISLGKTSQICYAGSLYMQKTDISYVFHMFTVCLEKIPDVKLSHEHQSYIWASSKDLERLSLMTGAKRSLEHYRMLLARKRN